MIRGMIMDAIFEEEMPRARLAVLLKHFSQIDDDREPWRGRVSPRRGPPASDLLRLLKNLLMPQILQIFGVVVATHMIALLAAIASLLSFRIRSCTSLELEVIALRHPLSVLKRQRPGRVRFFRADRLLWILLYRIWPQAISAIVLVKPATVLQWRRNGFRFPWRWRSRTGKPGPAQSSLRGSRVDSSNACSKSALRCPSDSWRVAQARYRREPGHRRKKHAMAAQTALPHWRSFLQNHMADTAAVDMFVVATATFKLLNGNIIPSRKSAVCIIGMNVEPHEIELACAGKPPRRSRELRAMPIWRLDWRHRVVR
jgi:hypothetical protein